MCPSAANLQAKKAEKMLYEDKNFLVNSMSSYFSLT